MKTGFFVPAFWMPWMILPGRAPTYVLRCPRISASSRTPPRLIRTYFLPSASAMLFPRLVFPGAGRSRKEEDRALLLALQFHDREVLDDPFLDFLKAVVVAFENFSRRLDIDVLLLFGLPREVEDEVEIVPDNGALVVVRAPGLQFPCLRKRLLPDIVGHLLGLDLFPVTVVAGTAFALV